MQSDTERKARWRNKHRELARKRRYLYNTHTYINHLASNADLLNLRQMINGKLS